MKFENIDFGKMTKNFILDESKNEMSIWDYVQSVEEAINNFSPRTIADGRRMKIAKEHMRRIRTYTRRLEEKLAVLEEQVKLLEEDKK